MTTPYREKIENKKQAGLYKLADFENGRQITHVISHLMENVTRFDKEMDILCFQDSSRQLQIHVANAEALMAAFGE